MESASWFGLVDISAWHSHWFPRKSGRYPFVYRIVASRNLIPVLISTLNFLVQSLTI